MSILSKNSILAKINLTNSMKSIYKIIECNDGVDKNIIKKYKENWENFNNVFKDIKENIQENKNKTFTFYKFEPDNLKKTINDLSNLENNLKLDELKKINGKIYDNLIKTRENETWEDIVNDVKANSVMTLNFFDDIESIKTNTLKNMDNFFEKRIFMKYNAEEYLEKMILKEDKEFSYNGLHLVEIDGKKRIKEFLEKNDNDTYDFEIYKKNAKEFLSNKVVEVTQTIIDDFKDIESEKYPSVKFQDLQINYKNKETGTLRKENEFIKNAFAIYLGEKKPYKKEEEIKEFLKENKEIKKDFSKEILKKYNILVFQKEVNKIIENFNPNNYDFLVEVKFEKYFGKTKYYEKQEIKNNEKSKEKEFF